MYNADFSRKGLSGNCWGTVHSLVKCIGLVIFSLCHTYRIDEILRFALHCILVMFNHSTLAGHYDIILIPLVDIKISDAPIMIFRGRFRYRFFSSKLSDSDSDTDFFSFKQPTRNNERF